MPKITLTIVTEKVVTVSDETLQALLANDPTVIQKYRDQAWDEPTSHELQYRDQVWDDTVDTIVQKYGGEQDEEEFRRLFSNPELYLGHGATSDTIPGVIHARYGTFGLFHR